MPRVFSTLAVTLILAATPAVLKAQPVPPSPGIEIPPALQEKFRDTEEFGFQHAWIEKARMARENRERYIAGRGFYKRDMLSAERSSFAVTGTFRFPVFCVKYSDSPAGDPFPIAQLQTKLFTGPYSPETLTQYYNEVSRGSLNLTGTVYGWYTLPQPNLYYVPLDTCFGMCGTVPPLVVQTVAANDAAVNFGQYDNDGPDGVPNSGDDDGYVDFTAFVQPERGGECGDVSNIWSHHGHLVTPYTTNDPRTGGGFIRVSDYVVVPIYNCDNTTLIDIGVLCHELGHAMGLPDLYDLGYDSAGVGEWCLMGAGAYNTTSQPAHLGAWSKDQLGWVNVIATPGTLTDTGIPAVENSGVVYRMDSPAQIWRWTECVPGAKVLYCGLSTLEANNRHWISGGGYGNLWDVTMSRNFHYNGSGPISLMVDLVYELQPTRDFGYVTLKVGNTTTTLATYTGVDGDVLELNLAPYFTGPADYTLSFRVKTDSSGSDADGGFPTTCGAMTVGAMYVIGGGENYSTNFANRADGWAQNPPFTEYFLVENRQQLGSDVHLRSPGLVVWHIDQGGQTGGVNNQQPRGVEVVQADGLRQLEANVNRGDAGDPFPGSTNNLLFTQATNPNSQSHSGGAAVWMQLTTGNGNPIYAQMYGGFPPPSPEDVAPALVPSGRTVLVQIDGAGFFKTPTAKLVPYVPGEQVGTGAALVFEFPSTTVEWLGSDRIMATFNLTGAPHGLYDVVVYNPGGASNRVQAAFTITGGTTGTGQVPLKFELSPNYPNPFNPSTTIDFQLASRVHVDLRVYDVSGAVVRTLVNETKRAGTYSIRWNGRDDHGSPVSSGVYFYRITAGSFSDVRKMTLLK